MRYTGRSSFRALAVIVGRGEEEINVFSKISEIKEIVAFFYRMNRRFSRVTALVTDYRFLRCQTLLRCGYKTRVWTNVTVCTRTENLVVRCKRIDLIMFW